MGRKKKLARFAEMQDFNNVIQPYYQELLHGLYPHRGTWRTSYFNNDRPIVLELGCGKGEYTLALARQQPQKNCIGIDRKGARIWRGAKTAIEEQMDNVLFIRTRIELIHGLFAPNEVDEIWITFPDPQPKSAKRRLTSSRFLMTYQKFCRPDATIHLKTDSRLLHFYTKALLEANKIEILTATDDLYQSDVVNSLLSVETFYEKQFLEAGKAITYLKFRLPNNFSLIEPPDFEFKE